MVGKMKYKDLQIVKHAIQYYVTRPWATEKEIAEENRLLEKVILEVEEMKNKYGIR